jgi:hypothetical protein
MSDKAKILLTHYLWSNISEIEEEAMRLGLPVNDDNIEECWYLIAIDIESIESAKCITYEVGKKQRDIAQITTRTGTEFIIDVDYTSFIKEWSVQKYGVDSFILAEGEQK